MSTPVEPRGFSFTRRAHELLAEVVGKGSFVVDATAGRGRDTLFLARLVGASGRVLALDLQAEAIRVTEALLQEHGLRERVELVHADHADLARHLAGRSLDAAVFNLGWLPGGDHAVITRRASSLAAVEACTAALRPRGRLVLVAYVGHPGGREEAATLLAHARRLADWELRRHGRACRGRNRDAPRLLTLEPPPS